MSLKGETELQIESVFLYELCLLKKFASQEHVSPQKSTTDELENGSDSTTITENDEDQETLCRGSQALGLTRNYVLTWTRRDAFREFYQNWFIACLQSKF